MDGQPTRTDQSARPLNQASSTNDHFYGLSPVFEVAKVSVPAAMTVPEETDTFPLLFSGDPGANVTVDFAANSTTTMGGSSCGENTDFLNSAMPQQTLFAGDPAHAVPAFKLCGDTNAEEDETLTLIILASTAIFDSRQAHCDTATTCDVTVTIEDDDTVIDVPHDWPLAPSTAADQEIFRLMFVTSETNNALSTLMRDYNDRVQKIVAKNGHAAIREHALKFRMVGCTATVDAITNAQLSGTGGKIYYLGGSQIADNYADFLDGTWDTSFTAGGPNPGIHEDGTRVTGSVDDVFTGCSDSGTAGKISAGGSDYDATLGTTAGPRHVAHSSPRREGLHWGLGSQSVSERSYYGLSPMFRYIKAIPNSVTVPATLNVSEPTGDVGITLTGNPGTNVSVTVSYADGTATGSSDCSVSGTDYDNDIPTSHTLSKGVETHVLRALTLCVDSVHEADETFTVTFTAASEVFDSSASNCSSGTVCTTTVTIADKRVELNRTLNPGSDYALEGYVHWFEVVAIAPSVVRPHDPLGTKNPHEFKLEIGSESTASRDDISFILLSGGDEAERLVPNSQHLTGWLTNGRIRHLHFADYRTRATDNKPTFQFLTVNRILLGVQARLDGDINEGVETLVINVTSGNTVEASYTLQIHDVDKVTYTVMPPADLTVDEADGPVTFRLMQDYQQFPATLPFGNFEPSGTATINEDYQLRAPFKGNEAWWHMDGGKFGNAFATSFYDREVVMQIWPLEDDVKEGTETITIDVESIFFRFARKLPVEIINPVFTVELTEGQPRSSGSAANSPARGRPTISGPPLVGGRLHVDTSDISDNNGLDDVDYRYQWRADGTDISGATQSSYVLTAGEAGKRIFAKVAFNDDDGHGDSLISKPTRPVSSNGDAPGADIPVVNAPPTGKPAIDGVARVGETLTADTSAISDPDGLSGVSFAYQWLADGEAVPGATQSSYGPVKSDLGKQLSVRVSFTDDAGHAESLTSGRTAWVLWPATCKDNAHKIGGMTLDAASVDGFSVSWTALDCPGDYLVRYWQTDDKANTFTETTASGASYSAAGLSAGTEYTVRALYRDPDGGRPWKASPPFTVTTPASQPVQPDPPAPVVLNSPASGQPTISGTTQVGETLTADASAISDSDGMSGASFAYQWLADGAAISGATASSYTLTSSEQGRAVSVRVSFTDDAGNAESLTSVATDPVAGKPQPLVLNSPASGQPTISGTTQVGETLTADTSAITDSDGLSSAAYSYQWVRNDGNDPDNAEDVEDATEATYELTDADEGKTITLRVSFTDDAGHAESVASEATEAVLAKPLAPPDAVLPVGLSVSDARVSENSSPAGQFLEFKVSLDKPAEDFVMVSFETRDVTATAGSFDYYTHPGVLSFHRGEQEKVVLVYVPPDDGRDEGAETMELVITWAVGAPIADGTGVGTITD